MNKKRSYNNNYSLMFGWLCFGVVYLHSGWAGGFDVYSLGIGNKLLEKIISLFLMSIVPSFFILWGYLSCKYIYSSENAISFLKKKIIQFYPIYFFFFLLNVLVRFDYMTSLANWKLFLAFLGFYYESGLWGGGNIYLIVNSVIITLFCFKFFKVNKYTIVVFSLGCLFLSKMLPHESTICYIQYFGYYAAFFLGILLKHVEFFENQELVWQGKLVLSCIVLVGIGSPILNFFGGYFLEIQYDPNSPEQLFFCSFVIYLINLLIIKLGLEKTNSTLLNYIHLLGNNAYDHFIVQAQIIRIIIFLSSYGLFNKIYLQLFIISFTSAIAIFFVLPLYNRLQFFVFRKLSS